MAKSHRGLDIYKEALTLFLDVHQLSRQLPKFELYELGSQMRRAADSTINNIVEGYGRRKYKAEFIRFLTFSHGSNLELTCHLEKAVLLYPDLQTAFNKLLDSSDQLSRKLYRFIEYVENSWESKPRTQNS